LLQTKTPAKFIGLFALTAFLMSFTGILAALPMRVSRRVFGRLPFWFSSLALATAFFAMHALDKGVLALLLTVLIGVYAEVEEHGEGVFVSGLTAVCSSLGLTAVAATLWLMRSGSSLIAQTKAYALVMVEEMTKVNPDVQIDVETLVRTMPSAIVITLVLALGLALIWDRVAAALFRVHRAPMAVSEALRAFALPDIFVWITTASIFAAYYKHGNALAETIGLNVFYTMVALYFFQGVAVIAQGFRTFKVGPVWQMIWAVMIVLQFYAVAFLGFADFWIDFRSRFQRRPETPNSRA
jgi:hypothetical protein